MKTFAIILLILSLLSCTVSIKREHKKDTIEESKNLITKEKYFEAYNLLKKNKEKLASNSNYWQLLGKVSLTLGKLNEAIKYYEIALSLENDYQKREKIAIKLAYLYLVTNYFSEAEKIAQKILEKNPENIYANLILGRIDFLKGRIKELKMKLEKLNKENITCENYLEIGDLYLLSKKPQDAIKNYLLAQKKCPKKIEPLLALANVFFLERDFNSTEKYIKEAINLAYEKSEKIGDQLKAYLAEFYIKIHKGQEALLIYKVLYHKYPQNYFYAVRTSELALQQKDFKLAEKILNEIEQKNPNLFYIPYLKGHLYLLQGKTKEATIYFTQAASKEENPQAFYYLGISQWLEGLEHQATISFKKAIKLNPAHLKANLALSCLALKNGELKEAKIYLQRIKSISTKAYLLETSLLLKQKSCEKAKKEIFFLRDINEHPKEIADLWLSYKFLCEGKIGQQQLPFQAWIIIKNQPEKIFSLNVPENLKIVLRITENIDHNKEIPNIDYNPILYLKALEMAKEGEKETAIQILEKITKKVPHFGPAWTLLGSLYLQEKDYHKAAHAYRNAINCKQKDPFLWNNLAWASLMISLEKGEIPEREALRAAENAFSLAPENPIILDTLALVYYHSGMKELACRTIEKAFKLAPQDKQIKDHFFTICPQEKQTDA